MILEPFQRRFLAAATGPNVHLAALSTATRQRQIPPPSPPTLSR